MPAALGSFANPSKIMKIFDFPREFLPDSGNSSKFLPGSRKSAPRARRLAQNLPDCQIFSKPTASSGPRNIGFRGLKNLKKRFASDAWFRSRWLRRFLSFLPISILLNRAQLLNALVPPPISFLEDTPVSKRPKTCPKTVQKRAPPPGMRHLKTREVLALIGAPFSLQNSGRLCDLGSLPLSSSASLVLSSLFSLGLQRSTAEVSKGTKVPVQKKKVSCVIFRQQTYARLPPINFSVFDFNTQDEVAGVTIL